MRPTHPDLPIIVLTAKGGIDSAVEAMRAGANDFLVKPASPERIAVSIRNALNGLPDVTMPTGGFKESGWGRELGPEGMDLFLETSSVFTRLD